MLVLSLRESTSYGSESEMRTTIRDHLEQMAREAKRAGFGSDDIKELEYPLVAFIDETILNSDWTHRQAWKSNPMQLERFGETVAGERFFERLERIRAGGEAKLDLLEIYYYCLALGFQGKYGLGGDRLRKLTTEVRKELGFPRSEPDRSPLSAYGRRSGQRASSEAETIPFLRIAAICAAVIVVSWIIFAFLMEQAERGALRQLGGQG